MQFNILYHFLSKRTFKPTTKAKCRVYMAKDLKSYDKRYYAIMHQLIGAQWNPIMQNIDYDALFIKKFIKFSAIIVAIFISMYVYLF